MNKSRRNFMFSTAAVITTVFGFTLSRQLVNKKVSPTANARLGINLASIVDWSTEFPFVDLFKQSRAWFIEGKELVNSGLEIDANGWVSQLPLGMAVSTIISSLDNSHFPSGEYVILYDGEGEIKVPNHPYRSVKLDKSASTERLLVNVDGQKEAFRLDPLRCNSAGG